MEQQHRLDDIKALGKQLAYGTPAAREAAAEQLLSLANGLLPPKAAPRVTRVVLRAMQTNIDPSAYPLRLSLGQILVSVGRSASSAKHQSRLVAAIVRLALRHGTVECVRTRLVQVLLDLLKAGVPEDAQTKMVDAFVFASGNGPAAASSSADQAFDHLRSSVTADEMKKRILKRLLRYVEVNDTDPTVIEMQFAAVHELGAIARDPGFSRKLKSDIVQPLVRAAQTVDNHVRLASCDALRHLALSKDALTQDVWTELITALTGYSLITSDDDLVRHELSWILDNVLGMPLENRLREQVELARKILQRKH